MERVYGWPAAHERGYPDLCGGEEVLGTMFDNFNRNHQAVRAVLVNQWDWNRRFCGERMPEDMTFADIRRGTDVEFGLSVYEPFGISQFEPLSCGALCAVSNVCGCVGFARRTSGGQDAENVIVGDYLTVPEGLTVEQLLDLPTSERDRIESQENQRLATVILQRLPRDAQTVQRRIEAGNALAAAMSWEHVVREYFLPSLVRATARR